MSTLEHRTFTADGLDRADNPDVVGWLRQMQRGFVGEDFNEAQIDGMLADAVADDWLFRGVYDTQAPAYAVDDPVATFVTYDKTFNVGAPAPIPVTCITEVTVRATHRRRGLLRSMMTAELDRAKERGHALAALTVTEGTIYGRFGFGPTSFTHGIEVDTSRRFGLRGETTGSVHAVSREEAARLGDEVFARVHATRYGSMGRVASYSKDRSGLVDHRTGSVDRKRQNVVHTDADGRVDGWVAYGPEDDRRGTLRIHEFLTSSRRAYLALWDHLGSIDLITKVVWGGAPTDDVLRWALDDTRGYRVVGLHDGVWTRVLDPVTLLSQRGYADASGRLVLRVVDDLGYADGIFKVDVVDGHAEVWRTDLEPDLTCSAEELGPLVLGGADPRALCAAGRLDGSDAALGHASTLFDALGRPYTTTHF